MGLNGRATLVDKGRTIEDNREANCPVIASVTYDPPATTITSGSVLATMTLDQPTYYLDPLPTGWVLSGVNSGGNYQYSKTYTQNTHEAPILTTTQPQTGMADVVINHIDTTNLSGATGAFVMTRQTTMYNDRITIGTLGSGYDFTIDWGDGTTGSYSGTAPTLQHIYATPGWYQMRIRGDFPQIVMSTTTYDNNLKLKRIDQRGDIVWRSMAEAFQGATNLNIAATDLPNFSQVTSMYRMFMHARNLTGNFSGRDTSNVTTMAEMFHYDDNFTSDLNTWNVGNVTNMNTMFAGADRFNGVLSGRDTSNVTTMSYMFSSADRFNQDIGNWDTSKVTNMQ
jgi:surface protein